MEFFHSLNYFFLQLLKITFSLKIVGAGAIAPIALILTRPLVMIVKNCYSVNITGAFMMGVQSVHYQMTYRPSSLD